VHRGLTKAAADRIGSAEYVQTIDEILRAEGIHVTPAPLSVRASQSIGIPVGPFGVVTPASGGTPLAGMLTPNPSFLATATALPAVSRIATATRDAASEAEPGQAALQSASRARRYRLPSLAIAALAVVACTVVAAVWLDHDSKASQAQPAAATPAAAQPMVQPSAGTHDASLKAALHDLEQGATCTDRKNAIARLVELRDPKAIPAIKKARARGKANACLRATANEALKALAGRI
jgi:hypothetical protein